MSNIASVFVSLVSYEHFLTHSATSEYLLFKYRRECRSQKPDMTVYT